MFGHWQATRKGMLNPHSSLLLAYQPEKVRFSSFHDHKAGINCQTYTYLFSFRGILFNDLVLFGRGYWWTKSMQFGCHKQAALSRNHKMSKHIKYWKHTKRTKRHIFNQLYRKNIKCIKRYMFHHIYKKDTNSLLRVWKVIAYKRKRAN